jgi:hypothetical protein
MTSTEASQLSVGQHVSLPDGRVCSVSLQDTVNQLIQLEFEDGTIGGIRWVDLTTTEVVDSSIALSPPYLSSVSPPDLLSSRLLLIALKQ